MNELVRHLDRLTSAGNVEELWDIHTKKMGGYGFDRLIYGFTRYLTSSSLGDPQDWILLSTQSPEYMNAFIDEGLYFHAPMLKWALANDGACSWRWMVDKAQTGDLTDGEKRVLQFNRQMDVTAGYTISFRSISRRTKAAIALTGKIGVTQDVLDETWARHGEEIIVMNNVMHLKLLSLPHSGERHLTKRQREVLQWIGDGKTNQDVAILLGLTPATVEKHLRLAREALDVETTAQAVLKAGFHNQMFVLDTDG